MRVDAATPPSHSLSDRVETAAKASKVAEAARRGFEAGLAARMGAGRRESAAGLGDRGVAAVVPNVAVRG